MLTGNARLTIKRNLYWLIVLIYALALPEAILVYKKLTVLFKDTYIHLIPTILSLFIGLLYLYKGLKRGNRKRLFLFFLPCLTIYFLVRWIEPYPNKQIHVPEYILMAWIVFYAVSVDYEGRGLLILVFILSSLLGCVDEIIQGIHPARFYGWKDIVVNTLSVSIGVLMILGFYGSSGGNWNWFTRLKNEKVIFYPTLSGFLAAGFTLYYLFQLKNSGSNFSTYPLWLTSLNCFYIVYSLILLPTRANRSSPFHESPGTISRGKSQVSRKTTCLWVYGITLPLVIIHTLALYIRLTHSPFK